MTDEGVKGEGKISGIAKKKRRPKAVIASLTALMV